MRIELLLSQTEGETELRLVHHLDPHRRDRRGTVPAGSTTWTCWWRRGTTCPRPSFDDYYPAMKRYYEALPTQTDPA